MRKLIAFLVMVSFMTVSAGSAFADPRNDRGRGSNRGIERRQERRPSINRTNRPGPNRRPSINRRNHPGPNRFERNRRPIIRRPDRPYRPDNRFRRSRPIARPHRGFFNRAARTYPRYRHRPMPRYDYHHHHGGNSMSALEFLGVGAALIAIASAVSNASAYDY